jgi:hypothetical protein
MRTGLAEGVSFPRVLGIEAAGIVASAPGGEFAEGQQVCATMGGMGRQFDGGYAGEFAPCSYAYESGADLRAKQSTHAYGQSMLLHSSLHWTGLY